MRLDPTEAEWGIDPFDSPDDGLTEDEMVVRDRVGPGQPVGVAHALMVVERDVAGNDIDF